jgi:hypothetical protein
VTEETTETVLKAIRKFKKEVLKLDEEMQKQKESYGVFVTLDEYQELMKIIEEAE